MSGNNRLKRSAKISFMQTSIKKAHQGVVKEYRFKAMNRNAINIHDTMVRSYKPLYNLIEENRSNINQRIQISITERFSKIGEVYNKEDLTDLLSGKDYDKDEVALTTNKEISFNKYYQSDIFAYEPTTDIKDLTQSLLQKRVKNIAAHDGSSGHTLKYIKKTFIRFHGMNLPNARTYIPTPKKL